MSQDSTLSRNPREEAKAKALRDLLQYFSREPNELYRVGPIAEWLRGGYPLERVVAMLEELADGGLLRRATEQELRERDFKHGYFLTEEGLAALPPEDRSYGVD